MSKEEWKRHFARERQRRYRARNQQSPDSNALPAYPPPASNEHYPDPSGSYSLSHDNQNNSNIVAVSSSSHLNAYHPAPELYNLPAEQNSQLPDPSSMTSDEWKRYLARERQRRFRAKNQQSNQSGSRALPPQPSSSSSNQHSISSSSSTSHHRSSSLPAHKNYNNPVPTASNAEHLYHLPHDQLNPPPFATSQISRVSQPSHGHEGYHAQRREQPMENFHQAAPSRGYDEPTHHQHTSRSDYPSYHPGHYASSHSQYTSSSSQVHPNYHHPSSCQTPPSDNPDNLHHASLSPTTSNTTRHSSRISIGNLIHPHDLEEDYPDYNP